MNREKPKDGDITKDRHGYVIYQTTGSKFRVAHIYQDTIIDPDTVLYNIDERTKSMERQPENCSHYCENLNDGPGAGFCSMPPGSRSAEPATTKVCETCKHWNDRRNIGQEIGICLNPTMPVGRSCDGKMSCEAHEARMQMKPFAPLPMLMQEEGLDACKPDKALALRMNETHKETLFVVGDYVNFSLMSIFRITKIEKKTVSAYAVDKLGNQCGEEIVFMLDHYKPSHNWEYRVSLDRARYANRPENNPLQWSADGGQANTR